MQTVYDSTAPLDSFFKFQIGDLVAMKAQDLAAQLADSQFREITPQIGQIVERSVQQCYGGIQVHYALRLSSANWRGGTGTVQQPFSVTEPELEPAPAPTPKPAQSAEPPQQVSPDGAVAAG